MKRIISAWIEQILEFESEMEYAAFQHDLKNGKKQYKILSEEKKTNGRYRIHLRKQYNNNQFPED